MGKIKKGLNKNKDFKDDKSRLVDYKTLERNIYNEISKEFDSNKKDKKK